MRASVLLAAVLACCAPARLCADGFAGLGQESPGFATVTPGAALAFPRDFGAHPGFRTEWWYLTANLRDAGTRAQSLGASGFSHGMVVSDRQSARRLGRVLRRAMDAVPLGARARPGTGGLGRSGRLHGPCRRDDRERTSLRRDIAREAESGRRAWSRRPFAPSSTTGRWSRATTRRTRGFRGCWSSPPAPSFATG